MWCDVAAVVAETAFRIRAAQEFLDGNHHPMVLYSILSCRDYATPPQQAIELLAREVSCAQKHKLADDEIEKQALLVKQLPIRVSGYFQLLQELRRVKSEEAVARLRDFKHQDSREYAIFSHCFKREIGKVFKVVDHGCQRSLKREFMDACFDMGIKFLPSED
ncbi:hypothetical protein FN846DRAFT_909454 [Sphaerosporella brunnea]|uniref:Uncharacterized protein n=1 Tax=Sphaerosporella brunnea TaxID=1250544 RepID=A0A5J5EPN1_9PEZI|nr:hypothetical protein FN846DRAFT_909454 [Sphaerosporella brunnea]